MFVSREGFPVLADPQDSAAEALRDGRLWSISVSEDHQAIVAVLVGVADGLVEGCTSASEGFHCLLLRPEAAHLGDSAVELDHVKILHAVADG